MAAVANPGTTSSFASIADRLSSSRSLGRQQNETFTSSAFARTLDSTAALRDAVNGTSSNVIDNQMQPLTYLLWFKLPYATDGTTLIKGSMLFFNAPREDLKDMKPLAFTLTSLNYALEKTAREQAGVAAMLASSNEPMAKRPRFRGPGLNGALDGDVLNERTLIKEIDRLYVQGTNPDEPFIDMGGAETTFAQKYTYGGFVQHIEEGSLQMQKLVTMAVARHLEIPNLWGIARQGQVIGLAAKWLTKSRYENFQDASGRVAGKSTTVPFIQMLPQTCERRMPRHNTGAAPHFNPTDDDLDAIVTRTTKQRLNKIDAKSGLVLCDDYVEDVDFELTYDAYTFGLWFPVGTITATRLPTTESTIRTALRNPTSYMALQGSNRIDVQLCHV